MSRRGSVASGCMGLALLVAVAAYLALTVGRPYFRYYRFRDAADQEAKFATMHTDEQMEQALRSVADSLQLPPSAAQVTVIRSDSAVRIQTAYDDSWRLFRYVRPVHFVVDVARRL